MPGPEYPPLTDEQRALLDGSDVPDHMDIVVKKWVNGEMSKEDFDKEVLQEAERRRRAILGSEETVLSSNRKPHQGNFLTSLIIRLGIGKQGRNPKDET